MIAHRGMYNARSFVNFSEIFTDRTEEGRRGRGRGWLRAGNDSTNARRLHSATMTNLIAAFRDPPDNYDDTPRARELTPHVRPSWLSGAIKND